MTSAEDATMSEGKQCLQRDVTEAGVSRRGAGRTCLMFVVFVSRMMRTLQWSRPETSVSSQPTCCCSVSYAIAVCCAEVFLQPSFFLVVSTWHAEWNTERTMEPDIVQTERVLTRLVDTASLDSRLH